MEPLLAQLQGNALLFGLMSLRVGALFATAPVLSSRSIPMRVKGGLTIALVLSVLVILGLVVGVRVVRKTEDIASTLIAVVVGAMVTLGPLALQHTS